MGKKKMVESIMKSNKRFAKEDVVCFMERMFQNADDVRNIAGVSKELNEFSEAFDTMVDKIMDMKKKDIRLLSRHM